MKTTDTTTTTDCSLASVWLAAYESIQEMTAALTAAGDDEGKREAAQTAIQDAPLSVEVRSDWYAPGSDAGRPAEFCILLSTGGPASRIIGTLSEHGLPETARLEVQDWGTPWTDAARDAMASACTVADWEAIEPTLLAYASEFYFGE